MHSIRQLRTSTGRPKVLAALAPRGLGTRPEKRRDASHALSSRPSAFLVSMTLTPAIRVADSFRLAIFVPGCRHRIREGVAKPKKCRRNSAATFAGTVDMSPARLSLPSSAQPRRSCLAHKSGVDEGC